MSVAARSMVAGRRVQATQLTFTVRGRPVPQGGLTAYARGSRAILTHKRRPELEAWRSAIAAAASEAIGDAPLIEGPVAVSATFVLERPRSHFLPANARRPTPELRLDAPVWHAGKPDLDKLVRALLDALTAVVIRDDSQVASLGATKHYEGDGLKPGVVVVVRTLEVTR
jgi:Holliday junction resolvase RusA-like endonuclease